MAPEGTAGFLRNNGLDKSDRLNYATAQSRDQDAACDSRGKQFQLATNHGAPNWVVD